MKELDTEHDIFSREKRVKKTGAKEVRE